MVRLSLSCVLIGGCLSGCALQWKDPPRFVREQNPVFKEMAAELLPATGFDEPEAGDVPSHMWRRSHGRASKSWRGETGTAPSGRCPEGSARDGAYGCFGVEGGQCVFRGRSGVSDRMVSTHAALHCAGFSHHDGPESNEPEGGAPAGGRVPLWMPSLGGKGGGVKSGGD